MNHTNNNDNLVSVGKAAEILGVSINTLHRWEAAGRITAQRSPGGHRLFLVDELKRLKEDRPLTTGQVAAKLGVSTSTVRRLEKEGRLSAQHDKNGKRLFSQESLSAYQIHGSSSPARLPTEALTKAGGGVRGGGSEEPGGISKPKIILIGTAVAIMLFAIATYIVPKAVQQLSQPPQAILETDQRLSAASVALRGVERVLGLSDPGTGQILGLISAPATTAAQRYTYLAIPLVVLLLSYAILRLSRAFAPKERLAAWHSLTDPLSQPQAGAVPAGATAQSGQHTYRFFRRRFLTAGLALTLFTLLLIAGLRTIPVLTTHHRSSAYHPRPDPAWLLACFLHSLPKRPTPISPKNNLFS